jgi:hypothetical protein
VPPSARPAFVPEPTPCFSAPSASGLASCASGRVIYANSCLSVSSPARERPEKLRKIRPAPRRETGAANFEKQSIDAFWQKPGLECSERLECLLRSKQKEQTFENEKDLTQSTRADCRRPPLEERTSPSYAYAESTTYGNFTDRRKVPKVAERTKDFLQAGPFAALTASFCACLRAGCRKSARQLDLRAGRVGEEAIPQGGTN